MENSQMGVDLPAGETDMRKRQSWVTLYLLVEADLMSRCPRYPLPVKAMTNLREIHEKLNTYWIFEEAALQHDPPQPGKLLKRYLIVEPLDV